MQKLPSVKRLLAAKAQDVKIFLSHMKNLLYLLFAMLLLLAACGETAHEEHAELLTYTCPMHPQIVQNEPGTCPICFMDLVPVTTGGEKQGELMLSESQMLLANIKTMPASVGIAGTSSILTGKLVLDETQNELISSRVAGRIERLYVKETGQQIQKGQPLYAIYSEELLSLQREYLLALEQYKALGSEEPRYASFLEAARTKLLLYGLSEQQVRQLAQSGKPEAQVTFLAPAAGVVTDIAATEGQYVAEGSILYRLGDLDKIWVEAELYPYEIENIRPGTVVQVDVQGFAKQPIPAKVTFISPELRQGSQVVLLRAELNNPEQQFLPGMQANVILPQTQRAAISLPNDAVIRDSRGSHVWVQTGEGTFKARRVELGEADFDSVTVLSGIEPRDLVVSSGAYLLYSEYVLKKGGDPIGNPVADPMEAQAVDLAQTSVEAFVLGNVADYRQLTTPPFKQKFAAVLQAYLELKNALVAGNLAEASAASTMLIDVLADADHEGLIGEPANFWLEKTAFLMQHAKESLEASTLVAKRENFIYLSQPIIKLTEAFGSPAGLYIQYCPMANDDKGAYWLSAEAAVLNPYFGEAMLRCGEVIKKL